MLLQAAHKRQLGFRVLVFGFLCRTALGQSCYLPNGLIAQGATPCGSGSTCCDGTGSVCLPNGYCFEPSNNLIVRPSCTDTTWASCPSDCKNANPGAFEALTPCGDNKFCCGLGQDASACCDSGSGFVLNTVQSLPAVAQATVTVTSTSVSTQTVTTTTTIVASGNAVTITDTSTIKSTLTTTVTSDCPSCPNKAGATVSVTHTTTAPCDSTSTPTSGSSDTSSGSTSKFDSSCPDCSHKELIVGAGVGAPLGAALLIALLLLFCQTKKPWHQQPKSQPQPQPQPMVGAAAGPRDPYAVPYVSSPSSAPEFAGYARPHEQRSTMPVGYNSAARRPVGGEGTQQDPRREETASPVSSSGDGRYELGGNNNINQRYGEQPPVYHNKGY